MPQYTDAEDGLYISTVHHVYSIPAVRGSIFAAHGGDWEDSTRVLWPLAQRDEEWSLDEQFETEEVLPLTRDLILGYLAYRTDNPPVDHGVPRGSLIVNVLEEGSSTPRGRLNIVVRDNRYAAPLALGWEDARTRGWNYDGWDVIHPAEADALADYALRYWNGARGRDPVGTPVADGDVEDLGSRRIQVRRTWMAPDDTQAQTDEQVVDGTLVRTVRVPLVEHREDAVYVEADWAESVLRSAGAKHGRSHGVRELLRGHVYDDEVSWPGVGRVVWDGREYLSVPDVGRLARAATDHYGWCSTAEKVTTVLSEGDVGKRWSMRVTMQPTETPPWGTGVLFETYVSVPAPSAEAAQIEGIRMVAAWVGCAQRRLVASTPQQEERY